MTARQLVDFVEAKLKEHGIKKAIPDKTTLQTAYRMYAASDRLSNAFDEVKEKLKVENQGEDSIKVPADLEAKVKAKLQANPA